MVESNWASGSFDWTEESLRLFSNPSQHVKDNYPYIQEIGYFETHGSYYTEREDVDSYLIIYTVAGEGKLTYRGKDYVLKQSTICFIDCRDYQYYQTVQDTWDFYWVHIYGEQVLSYFSDFSSSESVICATEGNSIQFIIERIIQLQKNKLISTEIIVAREIINLLTEMLIEKLQINFDVIDDIPPYIIEMQAFIDKSYAENIKLDYLSEKFLVSKYQLSKEYKKHIGLSPIDYLIDTRINKAKELLKYTDYNINEISELVGIHNTTHFINLFKKRVGYTPLQFRKYWK